MSEAVADIFTVTNRKQRPIVDLIRCNFCGLQTRNIEANVGTAKKGWEINNE